MGTRDAAQDGVVYALNQVLAARPLLKDSTADPAALLTSWAEAIVEVEAVVGGVPIDAALDPADLALLKGALAIDLAAEVPQFLANQFPHLAAVVDVLRLVHLGLRSLFCRPKSVLSGYTGVVVAGYGADDFMPGYMDCHVYGFVGSRVYWHERQALAVNHTDKASLIEPFARKSMVETFTQGASPEVWKAVRDAFVKHTAKVVADAAAGAGVEIDQAHIDASIVGELDEFTRTWAFSVFGAHLAPLRSVIASLNVEELAELAETMVMLESLKEKVTSRMQGVGGPIDLAVITKSEGLVWIKRKHYFNPELNQRYLLRLQRGV
jgi:hypothetical protein